MHDFLTLCSVLLSHKLKEASPPLRLPVLLLKNPDRLLFHHQLLRPIVTILGLSEKASHLQVLKHLSQRKAPTMWPLDSVRTMGTANMGLRSSTHWLYTPPGNLAPSYLYIQLFLHHQPVRINLRISLLTSFTSCFFSVYVLLVNIGSFLSGFLICDFHSFNLSSRTYGLKRGPRNRKWVIKKCCGKNNLTNTSQTSENATKF